MITKYLNRFNTYIYTDKGELVSGWGDDHEGSYASGNCVIIDCQKAKGYKIVLEFDDQGHQIGMHAI